MQIQNNLNIGQKYNIYSPQSNNINKAEAQKNVSKSIYNSTCPIGANYYSPSFGLNNPQAALHRAEKLQEIYAEKGLNYLLPKDVWNNKKIFKVLNTVGKKFDELVEKNDLNKKSLNLVLASVLPVAVAKKVEVKDFKDMAHDLTVDGYEPDEVMNMLRTYAGMAYNKPEHTTIYLPVNRGIETPKEKIGMKSTFLHELKHSLTSHCTNIETYDRYNKKILPQKTMADETDCYNRLFMNFEQTFRAMADGCPVELTKENMIQSTVNEHTDKIYDDEKSLLEDMEKEISNLIKKEIEDSQKGQLAMEKLVEYGYVDEKTMKNLAPDGILTDEAIEQICKKNPKSSKQIKSIIKQNKLPDDAFTSKTFWTYMQHKAMDEKEAYRTENVLRDYYDDKTVARDWELQSLVYGEMEKFFRGKVKAAK